MAIASPSPKLAWGWSWNFCLLETSKRMSNNITVACNIWKSRDHLRLVTIFLFLKKKKKKSNHFPYIVNYMTIMSKTGLVLIMTSAFPPKRTSCIPISSSKFTVLLQACTLTCSTDSDRATMEIICFRGPILL